MRVQCPICAQPLDGGELVMVCTPCHKSLGGSGGLSLGATGEFRVPPELHDETSGVSGEHPTTTSVCAWCGKLEHEVKKLLGRNGIALCNECVSLCSDILEAELGDSWR